MNCWEFKKCGREPGGAKVAELGLCPAYPKHGKCCSQVAGTLCEGRVQGSFAMKMASCSQCDFYQSSHYAKAAKASSLLQLICHGQSIPRDREPPAAKPQ